MTLRALGEARWILAVLAAGWIATLALVPWVSIPFAVLLMFSLWFFRDPERIPPADASLGVAPADGVVMDVRDAQEEEFLGAPVRRIVIFLSIFDVHVNRSPLSGEVTHSVPRTGRFLDARDPESSEVNARRTWVIRGPLGTVIVRQITGAIARRICPWAVVGDALSRGERIGMIRFGSRTEADFPAGTEILVKPGDRVRGGETPIARITVS